MIGIVKTEYITICDIDIDTKSLKLLCEDIAKAIMQEEQLKDLGIYIDDYL